MRASEALARALKTWNPSDIRRFIEGVTDGSVVDCQLGAFLMAVKLQGLPDILTAELALAMRDSGKVLKYPTENHKLVDKHSTGGVGDKVSLCLAPIVAAAGVMVPMISGRGLGHTGGTLDKLEAIPGYNVNLGPEQFISQVCETGVAIAAAGPDLAPADARMYSIRDVTGTVNSPELIASSILSKKLAEGVDAIVFDVKVGSGAFMNTLDEARVLADLMIRGCQQAGVKVTVVFTDMNAPIGRAIGNRLEVLEAIEVLQGTGPDTTRDLTLALAQEMLDLAGCDHSARTILDSGKAYAKFEEMVQAQGGRLDEFFAEPLAASKLELRSLQTGYIQSIEPMALGLAAMELGAGRAIPSDTIDPAVGIKLNKQVGDHVKKDESLLTIYCNDQPSSRWYESVKSAISITSDPIDRKSSLILAVKRS